MKSKVYNFILIFLFVSLMSGCAMVRFPAKLSPGEASKDHEVLIVPMKAPPILIQAWGPGTVLLFGPLGAMAADEASKEDRSKIAEELNKTIGDWKPEHILANECLSLIKQSSLIPIKNVTIANTRELPGAKSLREEEPAVFTAKRGGFGTTLQGKWMDAAAKWQRTKSNIPYKQDYPKNKSDWALEAGFVYISLEKAEKIELGIMLRFVYTNSREKVAAGAAWDRFKITPIKEISKIEDFQEDFHASVKKLCIKTLIDMGLISMKNNES